MNDWMEVQAKWEGNLGFEGLNGKGGIVQMGAVDGKPGVSPMEMLLLGLAGCTGVDVVHILKKKRQELKDLKLRVRARRAETHPRVYTDIVIDFTFIGYNLSDKAVKHAIDLSEEKYCSASVMLGKTAKITSNYEIIQAE